MTIVAMREYVSGQYPGRWPDRVRDMSDGQVMRIYYSMINRPPRGTDTVPKYIRDTQVRGGKQLSMFEEGYFQ